MTDSIVTEKRCSKCKEVKPRKDFFKSSQERTGLYSQCKPCTMIARHTRAILVPIAQKECADCKQTKPAKDFWTDKRTSSGLHHRCKTCAKKHVLAVFEKSKAQRAPATAKHCPGCKQTKGVELFWRDKTTLDGCSTRCKQCGTAKNRLKKSGTTPERFAQLLEEQKGLCAICGRDPHVVHKFGAFADHCHVSGVARAMLCGKCNTAIGMIEDSPERAYALWQYLLKHRQLALVV